MSEPENPFDRLLNREEAHQLAVSQTDPFVRAFVRQTLHTAHRLTMLEVGAKRPSAPFDLVFLVEIAREMAENREILQRFLDGHLTDEFGDPI